MEEIFLSLGSNLGDKSLNMKKALGLMEERIGSLEAISSVFTSESWGFEGEPFENMVVKYATKLAPEDLLKEVLAVEEILGRTRSEDGYSNRIIDIDIISYGDWIIKSKQLQIPHPHLHKRNFVLQPLVEIDPEWIHPVFLKSAKELAEESTDKIVVKCLK